jgi:4-hydroxythreonine-4-phosphate dehydrogenase
MRIIAITSGDPAGIGPEITLKGLKDHPLTPDIAYVVYGELAKIETPDWVIEIPDISLAQEGGRVYLIPIRSLEIVKGESTKKSGEVAYKILCRVVQDIKKHNISALLTGPVSKRTIQDFDSQFIGHTEFLAKEFNVKNFVMNFVSPSLSVALLTTHLPLREVSSQLNLTMLVEKLRLIANFSKKRSPDVKIALLGLNPHCGEGGLFGNEEEIFKQAIKELRHDNIVIEGPFAADSFFRYNVKDYFQVISAYHDQGLIPFKMLAGEKGVNVTLGLPFIRTSVDHGTAFDKAGKGIASEKSFVSALDLTEEMLKV